MPQHLALKFFSENSEAAARAAEIQQQPIQERREFYEIVEGTLPTRPYSIIGHWMPTARNALSDARLRYRRTIEGEVYHSDLIPALMCMIDNRYVLVATEDGFNGNGFSNIDALDHLSGNRISSPQVRSVNRGTRMARVVNLGGLIRIQKPNRSPRKKTKSILKIGIAS